MLSDKQCIEIAEKVWGWQYVYTGGERYGGYWKTGDSGRSMGHVNSIKYDVNSWAGFGKTVEAISQGKPKGNLKTYSSIEDYKKIPEVRYFTDYLSGLITKELFWEATHLAALEALE